MLFLRKSMKKTQIESVTVIIFDNTIVGLSFKELESYESPFALFHIHVVRV
jgi:hypothetical protein